MTNDAAENIFMPYTDKQISSLSRMVGLSPMAALLRLFVGYNRRVDTAYEYPTREVLAKELGISIGTVTNAEKSATQCKILSITGKKPRQVTLYEIPMGTDDASLAVIPSVDVVSTPPRAPKVKRKKSLKGPDLLDPAALEEAKRIEAQKINATSNPKKNRIRLSYGIDCIDMSDEELAKQPKMPGHWYSETGVPNEPDAILNDLQFACFYDAMANLTRFNLNLGIKQFKIGLLRKHFRDLLDRSTVVEIKKMIGIICSNWQAIRDSIAVWAKAPELNEQAIVHKGVLDLVAKLERGESVNAPVSAAVQHAVEEDADNMKASPEEEEAAKAFRLAHPDQVVQPNE
jgi:hypothetical protein